MAFFLKFPDYLQAICREDDTSKKVIEADEALTIQVTCVLSEILDENYEVESENTVIHLTKRFCFTASLKPQPALITFLESYPKNIKFASTPGFIFFVVLDNIINDYATILQEYETLAENIELHIREMEEDAYSDVVGIKNEILQIKRYAASLRDVLMRISGRRIDVISEDCRLSLESLLDHERMVVNDADVTRDILNNTLDQIDNKLMQNMNATMRVLTAFSAIFLPLAVITGIYGMNFHWIPELDWKYGYFYALSLMVVCAFSLLYLFRKMRWFG
jgi:magnesium/cobalt transport protein CorA